MFDGEDAAMDAILAGSIQPGTVLVIRYEGPKGGPGMREMLAITGALKGAGRGARLRARSPTAASAAARGASASATSRPRPSTAARSPSSRDGDRILHRRPRAQLDLLVDEAELARARRGRAPRPPRYTSGVLGKYAKLGPGRRDRRDHQHVVDRETRRS